MAYDQVPAHDDDINSVAFADETSQVFFTGSDDMLCKVWDRRSASESGVLVGHLSGITHVSSKGDGRYLITNSKDQSIKLWDIRRMSNSVRATLSFFSSCSRPNQPQPTQLTTLVISMRLHRARWHNQRCRASITATTLAASFRGSCSTSSRASCSIRRTRRS